MTLSDSIVHHKLYGKGKICCCDENTVEVQFDDCTKKFIFPDAFKTFLTLEGEKEQEYIDSIFAKKEQIRQEQIEIDRIHSEKARLHNGLPKSANSQAAFGCVQNDPDTIKNEGKVFVGEYLSGESKGMVKTPLRIYPNSCCLLTKLPENENEAERYIFGIFMAADDYIGSDCRDGYIPAQPEYEIFFDEPKCREFLYYDYFTTTKKKKTWGKCEMTYFPNVKMAQILVDILNKCEDNQRKTIEDFLEYFCELNKIEKNRIPGFIA